MKVLIDISRETYKDFARGDGWLCPDSCSDIANAMTKATIMPEDVTNGDVIKTVFPNIKVSRTDYFTVIIDGLDKETEFRLDWWSASYNQVSNIRKANWKKISPAGIYVCTECGQNIMTSNIECYKFCPGCGVKMKEE